MPGSHMPSGTAAMPAGATTTPTTQPVSSPRQAQRIAEPPTHEQLVAQVETHIRALDARFLGEPRDARWAAHHEQAIADFFSEQSLADLQLAAPGRMRSACHSASCRVAAHYPDARSAEQATQQLAMQLGDRLPYGAVMPRQLADGSVEVNAWYSARPISL